MSDTPQMEAGQTVADRYRINRVLGEGGMGVVYSAEHMLMRKEVALKVLHGEMCTMPEIVARFEREAIAAAAIDHPNVAGATDFGRLPDGACYLVLEFLKGESLRDEVRKGPMPLERALVIMRGIANGVAAAHSKNIVHRDLKPENVMLVEREGLPDFVKVLDFGIAKMDTHAHEAAANGQQIVTRVGTIFGTPEYMAPEQAVGDKVDPRADIFALGVLFLEILTGKCPFKGEVLNVLRDRILMTSMPDMSSIENEEVKALITKMMQRQPEDRVQSAGELLQAIDALEGISPRVSMARISRPSFSNLAAASTGPAATANTQIAAESSVTPPPATPSAMPAPKARPRWMIPAAVASAVGLLLVIVAFTASGGDDKTTGKDANKHHPASSAMANAKHAPPPPSVAAAEPVVSASAEPEAEEPEPVVSAAPTPSAKPAPQRPARRPQQQQRKTGPGGIYIPPPKEWFKGL